MTGFEDEPGAGLSWQEARLESKKASLARLEEKLEKLRAKRDKLKAEIGGSVFNVG